MASDNLESSSAQFSEGTVSDGRSSKKKTILIAGLAALVVVVVAAIALLFSTQTGGSNVVNGQVEISDGTFTPQVIEVQKGQSVTWTNTGEQPHYVLGDSPESSPTTGFDSGKRLLPGDTFTYTFEETGTFTYHDRENPIAMKGTVIVTE